MQQHNLERFGIAKFHHDLTAHSARRTWLRGLLSGRTSHDSNLVKTALPLANRFKKGGSFRTITGRIGGRLNIAAGKHLSGIGQKDVYKRQPHAERAAFPNKERTSFALFKF